MRICIPKKVSKEEREQEGYGETLLNFSESYLSSNEV